MKTKTFKSNFTVPIVLAVALVLVLSATFALFTETANGTRRFTLSNFTSSVDVSFDNFATTATGTELGGAKYYDVSLIQNAANDIRNLRVRVNYNGKGVGLVRVRVTEEWYETSAGVTTVRPYTIEMPYYIGDTSNSGLYSGSGNQAKWFDNRTNDYCFYYATPVYSTAGRTIPLIAGLDTSKIDFGAIDTTSTFVRLIVEADVVQVNRYPQYWGINVLPWGIHDTTDENYSTGRPSSATEVALT